MLNEEDVVPPSPTIKSPRKRKSRNNQKRRSSIVSLRSKQSKVNKQTVIQSNSVSEGEHFLRTSAPRNGGCSNKEEENSSDAKKFIYPEFDDETDDDTKRIPSLCDFDVHVSAKLLEKSNRFDLSQAKPSSAIKNHVFPSDFTSVTDFIASQSSGTSELSGDGYKSRKSNCASTNEKTPSPLIKADTLTQQNVAEVVKQVLDESIQFSEWIIPSDSSATPNSQPIEKTDKSSIVESILNDFSVDEVPSQDCNELSCSPPVLLLNKQNIHKYSRPSSSKASQRTLIYDEELAATSNTQCQGHNDGDNDLDLAAEDIDIDLNSSRLIVENIASLSTFYTQTKNHQIDLDFTANLSQPVVCLGIPANEIYSDIGILPLNKSDDEAMLFGSQDESMHTDENVSSQHSPTPNETPKVKDKSNDLVAELMNSDDEDIFHCLDTPTIVPKSKESKRNFAQISTPSTSSMANTPSISKADCDQRDFLQPKRLRFDIESNNLGPNTGFSSAKTMSLASNVVPSGFAFASGRAFNMSEKTMKRVANIFANVDPEAAAMIAESTENDETIDTKRICDLEKATEESPSPNQNVIIIDETFDASGFLPKELKSVLNTKYGNNNTKSIPKPKPTMAGFQTARGGNCNFSVATATKIKNWFGEDFDDLVLKENIDTNKPAHKTSFANAGQLNIKCGPVQTFFTTAGGSKLEVPENHLDRYRNEYKKVNVEIAAETNLNIDENSCNAEESFGVCKTPLNKFGRRAKAFTTSTPNPNSAQTSHAVLPITPINPRNCQSITDAHHVQDESNKYFEGIDNQEYDLWFNEDFTQQMIGNQTKSSNESSAMSTSTMKNNKTEFEIDIINVLENVKEARKVALQKQQADCFKKDVIRRRAGSLYMNTFLLPKKKLNELGKKPVKLSLSEYQQIGLATNVIKVTTENAVKFKFDMWNFYERGVCLENTDGIELIDEMRLIMDENSRVGADEIKSAFLYCPSVDPKLVPDHWLDNSLKWIIVKLASMERSFPHGNAGKCLTPENVLLQLKYRYDREIDRAQRSAIRRILERDDAAANRMVLYVSRILFENNSYRLELCDGWYAISSCPVDAVLATAIRAKKIIVGTKLFVQGAELIGSEEPCSPLEMPASARLKISANSTRRAKWHEKLGFCKQHWPFSLDLNSIHENGGRIAGMRAFILRIYPVAYIEQGTNDEGSRRVIRSEKAYGRHANQNDKKRFDLLEQIYCEVNSEIEKEYNAKRKSFNLSKHKLSDIDNGEELCQYLEHFNEDSTDLDLSSTQKRMLSNYRANFEEQKSSRVNEMVRERLDESLQQTKSSAVQRVRLTDAKSPSTKSILLSIWNAGELNDLLRENTFIEIQNATVSGMRGRDLQVNANARTSIRELKLPMLPGHTNLIRKLNLLDEVCTQPFQPSFNEFDTIGYVIEIEEYVEKTFQSVFIADAFHHILCIKFWNGVREYAYDDVIQVGRFLAINGLGWRPSNSLNRFGLAQAFVDECTTFSEHPKAQTQIDGLTQLRVDFERLESLEDYLDDCCSRLKADTSHTSIQQMNITAQTSNISINTSRNQPSFVDVTPESCSPLPSNTKEKLEKLCAFPGLPPIRYRLGTRSQKKFVSPVQSSKSNQ